jgi:hypothetical protein
MICGFEYPVYFASIAYSVLRFAEKWTVRTVREFEGVVGCLFALERETGIEPATNGLGSRYSTIELLPLVNAIITRALLRSLALALGPFNNRESRDQSVVFENAVLHYSSSSISRKRTGPLVLRMICTFTVRFTIGPMRSSIASPRPVT